MLPPLTLTKLPFLQGRGRGWVNRACLDAPPARDRTPTPNPSLAGRGTHIAQPFDEHARPLRAFASSRDNKVHAKPAKRPGAIPNPTNHPLPCEGRGPISQALRLARGQEMDACLRRQAVGEGMQLERDGQNFRYQHGTKNSCRSANDPIAVISKKPQTAVMRTALAILALAVAAPCYAEDNEQPIGWHYRGPTKDVIARIDYVFDDPDLRLIGPCMSGGPTLILFGGDYADDAHRFTLTVDEKSWDLPISKHEHGQFLAIDDASIGAATLQAERLITFRVGTWEQQVPASPLLQQYAHDCG